MKPLDEIRARYDRSQEELANSDNTGRQLVRLSQSADDIPRLLAAVEAVEKVADELAKQSEGCALDCDDEDFEHGWHDAHWAAAAQLREALTAALGGAE